VRCRRFVPSPAAPFIVLEPTATELADVWATLHSCSGPSVYRRGAPLPAVGLFTLSVSAPRQPRGSSRQPRGSPGRRAPLAVCRGASPARHGFPPPMRLDIRPARGSPHLSPGLPRLAGVSGRLPRGCSQTQRIPAAVAVGYSPAARLSSPVAGLCRPSGASVRLPRGSPRPTRVPAADAVGYPPGVRLSPPVAGLFRLAGVSGRLPRGCSHTPRIPTAVAVGYPPAARLSSPVTGLCRPSGASVRLPRSSPRTPRVPAADAVGYPPGVRLSPPVAGLVRLAGVSGRLPRRCSHTPRIPAAVAVGYPPAARLSSPVAGLRQPSGASARLPRGYSRTPRVPAAVGVNFPPAERPSPPAAWLPRPWSPLLSRHGAFNYLGHHVSSAAERRWRAPAGCLRLSSAPIPSLYVLKFLLLLLSHRTLCRPRAARHHSCCSDLHCIVVHHVIASDSNSRQFCTTAAY